MLETDLLTKLIEQNDIIIGLLKKQIAIFSQYDEQYHEELERDSTIEKE